jgi:hypothetical protein
VATAAPIRDAAMRHYEAAAAAGTERDRLTPVARRARAALEALRARSTAGRQVLQP